MLVVPTLADVERYRLELARAEPAFERRAESALEGSGAGARVEHFQGLLAEVLRRAGSAKRPLGRLARERALAAVLHKAGEERATTGGRPRAGERITPQAPPTAGVVRSLGALVEELEVERVTPARLRGALGAWAATDPGHAPHARRLGELFEGYRRGLERLRPARVSAERQATRALDALRRTPALWGTTPVLLYGFDDFTRLQLDAIETLGAVVGAPVTVSLTYEPGRAAFASRGDTFQRLLPLAAEHLSLPSRAEHYAPDARAALHHLERHIFEPDAPAPVLVGEALRLLEGGGERAELELVAEEVRGLLERGVPPGEIAVAHRSPETIAELLGEVFRAHRIPFALRRRLSFASTATGRALLGLLKAAFPEMADDGDGLRDLLAWLRAPGVPCSSELVDELEWRARRAGVTEAGRHGPSARIPVSASAAWARALWEAEHWPLETLDRLREAAQRNPAALIECTAAELERLGYAPQVPTTGDGVGSPAPSEAHAAQASVASEQHEARALAVGLEALEELRELARSAPQLAPDAHELIALLRGLEVVVGEEPSGIPEAVAVLDPLALRARRVRALFLCGLQEGVFPAPARPEPYLSEEERRGLAEASGLRLGVGGDSRQTLAAERYLLYAAISRPLELLVLSWHTADDDGLPAARSLFVDDICDLFAGDPHQTHARRALGEVSSCAPTEPAARPEEGIGPLRDPRVLADLGEQRLWSASGLQSWTGCPVQWFVERDVGRARPRARGRAARARGPRARGAAPDARAPAGGHRLRASHHRAAAPRARAAARCAARARARASALHGARARTRGPPAPGGRPGALPGARRGVRRSCGCRPARPGPARLPEPVGADLSRAAFRLPQPGVRVSGGGAPLTNRREPPGPRRGSVDPAGARGGGAVAR